jgi:small multidrug resistance family-3 protein
MTSNLMLFVVAAALEIAGCFAFWHWLRRGGSAAWAVVGIVSLVAFAIALARVDTPFAGRAYAAYGGVYIGMAVLWLWLSEGQRPTATDVVGAAVAIAGTLIILSPIGRR